MRVSIALYLTSRIRPYRDLFALTFSLMLHKRAPCKSYCNGGFYSGRTQVEPDPPSHWSHRLVVRTLASHAGSRGSTPLGTTSRSYFKGLADSVNPFLLEESDVWYCISYR